MDDCRVVAVADELSDTGGCHLGVFLSEIHRYLAHLHIVATAALAGDMTLLNVVVLADLL